MGVYLRTMLNSWRITVIRFSWVRLWGSPFWPRWRNVQVSWYISCKSINIFKSITRFIEHLCFRFWHVYTPETSDQLYIDVTYWGFNKFPPWSAVKPCCNCFFCFSTLLKNFWAWDRICTASLLLTCSAHMMTKVMKSVSHCKEALLQTGSIRHWNVSHETKWVCSSYELTLYFFPVSTKLPQPIHKSFMLVLCPPFPLFSYGIRLATLHTTRAAD